MPKTIAVTHAVIVEPVTAGDPANMLRNRAEQHAEHKLDYQPDRDPSPSATQLSPIGPDVWVFDSAPLRPGMSVRLTVHFGHASAITLDARVLAPTQMVQTAAAAAR